jgi:hypothetical protein
MTFGIFFYRKTEQSPRAIAKFCVVSSVAVHIADACHDIKSMGSLVGYRAENIAPAFRETFARYHDFMEIGGFRRVA